MRSLIFSLFLVLMVLISACYEDKGNYDYHELESVEIDTTGTDMLPEYSIMRFDTLHLNPHVYYEGREVNDASDAPLDYEWTIFSATSGAGANQTVDVIGNQK